MPLHSYIHLRMGLHQRRSWIHCFQRFEILLLFQGRGWGTDGQEKGEIT